MNLRQFVQQPETTRALQAIPWRRLLAVFCLVALFASGALGGKPAPPFQPNVVSTVYDLDANLTTQLLTRSDDFNGTNQASYSVSDPNVLSYVTSSLVELDLSNQTTRMVHLTFSSKVAGSVTAPLSDAWYNARVMTRCYDSNQNTVSLFAMTAGSINPYCSLRVAVSYNKANYVLVMAPIYAGTGYASVTCTAANSTGCTAWHAEPNLDATISGNVPTVAELLILTKSGEKPVGLYYNTYRIDFRE